ncbi:transmembrane protein 33-like [Centruroides sculpturatus]|uniref:transmembrane protein 33-like n=1 Tax=Centruroides sculpturatus TaxID=218467 RepID=UPI000C6CB018|nr:transmembrane protein 33-like [Centruroides sculpturatus]
MSETSQENRENSSTPQRRGLQPALEFLLAEKINTLLWMIRMGSIMFTVLYMIPLFGINPYNYYYKALMSNAATSALRLHQRLHNVRFSFTREFFAQLLLEDSCHYLFYSLIFLYVYPMTLVLLPIFLFAVLHCSSYSLTLLNKLVGLENNGDLINFFENVVNNQQKNFFRLIAFTEIFLMPLTIFMIFSGQGNILTPFIYYRFVTLRYASRRNPYTRAMFHLMKLTIETFCNHPKCPTGIRVLCYKLMGFISRLAPLTPTQ